MSFKRFGHEDLVYTTLVAKPEYKFIVHNGSVYRNDAILPSGDFSNNLNHVSGSEVSFHELNINRPSDSLVYGFISKDTTRYAYRSIGTSQFDDASQFQFGNILTQSYPLKAGISRIFVPAGSEFDDRTFSNVGTATDSHNNKKYIRALRNVIETRTGIGQSFEYADMGTKQVNMVCIPGIFYGSKMDKGSLKLNYYITGSLVATLQDKNKDGVLVETTGSNIGQVAGVALYEHGLMLLTGSWDLSAGSHTGNFLSMGSDKPSWLSFGTGMPQVGTSLTHGSVVSSSYEMIFKGTNKIPTLTMFAHAEKGNFNYSNNPTFLEKETKVVSANSSSYIQPKKVIKNITKSDFTHHSASFESVTFISKVGIYDENKNLIAIATLANPLKKTPSRDYMIKMRLDF